MECTLTAHELASLRELDKGLLAGPIPPEHKQKLIALHLIEIHSMEPILTHSARKLLMGIQ